MTTKLSSQQRLHREQRLEAAHSKVAVADIPAMHFRVVNRAEVAAPPVHPAQAINPSHSNYTMHALQILRTSLPLLAMDCFGVALGLILAATSVSFLFVQPPASLEIAPQLFSNGLVFILIYGLLGLYPGVGLNPIIELRSLTLGTLTAGAVLSAFMVAFGHSNLAQVVFIGTFTLIAAFAVPLLRITVRGLLSRYSWWGQPVLIIGGYESCSKLMAVLTKKASFGLRPIGMVQDHLQPLTPREASQGYLGTLSDICTLAQQHHVFWALIAPSGQRRDDVAETVRYCNSIPNVVMIPGFEEFPSLWNRTQDFGGFLGICYRERLLDPWAQFCKRAFDITAVLLGTIALSPFLVPLLLVTWICMKLNSPGPIFYGQERVGKDGHHFQAWKFRTMVVNADAALKTYLEKHPEKKIEWDVNQKLRQDPRVIPGIGNLLRKSSLDELPQLWNVLCGDMSLVGPRPFMTEQTQIYGERVALYRKVRPGITGLWQISGRNFTTFEERSKFDAYYVRNWSFWLDIFILGRTVRTVLFREGAF